MGRKRPAGSRRLVLTIAHVDFVKGGILSDPAENRCGGVRERDGSYSAKLTPLICVLCCRPADCDQGAGLGLPARNGGFWSAPNPPLD